MAGERIVVGSTGDDATARSTARRLRDEGHEVVFVGGHQTSEHLIRAAIAEDAARLVVDTDAATLVGLTRLCDEHDVTDITVVGCDVTDAH